MHDDEVRAYPLTWPTGRPRTQPHDRERAGFGAATRGARHQTRRPLTVAEGLTRVFDELRRMGVPDYMVRVSSNIETRADGLPYSQRREPEDPGVCVYFSHEDQPYALACDAWDRVADNLAAVAATIAAKRGIVRWRVGSFQEHFAGFKALPAARPNGARPWWEVLGVSRRATREEVRVAFIAHATKLHPDHNKGNEEAASEAMAELNRAKREAQEELAS